MGKIDSQGRYKWGFTTLTAQLFQQMIIEFITMKKEAVTTTRWLLIYSKLP